MLNNQYINFPIRRNVQADIKDRGSVVIDNNYNDENSGSDDPGNSEANSDYGCDGFEDFISNEMVKIEQGSHEDNIINKVFLQGMGIHAKDTSIVAIHKNSPSSFARIARRQTFQTFTQAIAQKSGGDANLRFAWYGCSRAEICHVLSHGFSICNETDGINGISLYPLKFLFDGLVSTLVDGNGLRHMLLCRVIMGKVEVIPAGCKQFQPSSTEFDSGVDNIADPRRFTVWSAFMNSHIFPAYVISFKAPFFSGLKSNQMRPVRPASPLVSFPALLAILMKYLEPSKMALIFKSHEEFKKNKITRLQLIRRVRQTSGDKVLIEIIRKYKDKLVIRGSGRGRKN